MEIMGLLTLLAGAAILFLPLEAGLSIVAAASLFGAAAAVILPAATIPPAHALLGFLLLRLLSDGQVSGVLWNFIKPSETGFWLLAVVLYAVLTAIFLPRLFLNQVDVFPMSGAASLERKALAPSGGNMTQSVYLIGDLFCFGIFAWAARTRKGFRGAAIAMSLLSVGNVVFALLDIITIQTSTTYLLSFMRNAPYVIYVDVAVGDSKRIIGSYTEASAFATSTIATFCFSGRLALGTVGTRSAAAVAIVSAILIALSTSSTGLATLGPCIALLYAGSCVRVALGKATFADLGFFLIAPALGLSAAALVMLDADLLNSLRSYFDLVISNKGNSDSAMERGAMNWDAYRVFVATYGLGAGLGSLRCSSFLLACLSNVGLIGSFLQSMFLGRVLLFGGSQEDAAVKHVQAAARTACVGTLLAASISGALMDLGLPFYMFAALACAAPQVARCGIRPFSLGTNSPARYALSGAR